MSNQKKKKVWIKKDFRECAEKVLLPLGAAIEIINRYVQAFEQCNP